MTQQSKQFDWHQMWVVFVKEMTEGIRDFRSLVPMVLFSLFIGPLVTIGLPLIAAREVRQALQEHYRVADISPGGSALSFLQKYDFQIVPLAGESKESALAKAKIDTVVETSLDFSQNLDLVPLAGKIPTITVYYDGKSARSANAAAKLGRVLDNYKDYFVKKRLIRAGINLDKPEYVMATLVSPVDAMWAASPFIQSMLVLILIFQAFVGVIYPSLDAITGERERGTLEALLTTTVNRFNLFLGKLAAITVSSYAVVLSTLAGFYLAQFVQTNVFSFLPPSMASILSHPLAVKLPLPCVMVLALVMLPLCLSMAASAMALATYARTVQQAQAYMLPLMVLMTIPLSVMAMGDVHLDATVALVPFLNSTIGMNDILSGRLALPFMMLSAAISLLYSILLVSAVAPVIDREDILFGIEESPGRRLKEQNFGRELFLLYSTIFLLMFYVSQSLVAKHHIYGIALTQIFVVLAPGLFLTFFWFKLNARQVLLLAMPRGGVLTLVGALMLAPLTVSVASLFAIAFAKIVPASEAVSKLMAEYIGLNTQPLWLLLFVIGAMPAICEELLFRGVILSLMPKRFSTTRLVLTVGLLFGAFHMSLMRLLPTAMLGCALTFIALRSRSIYPCMLLHAGHNMLSVLVAVVLKEHLEPWHLVIGVTCGLIGLTILIFTLRSADDSVQ